MVPAEAPAGQQVPITQECLSHFLSTMPTEAGVTDKKVVDGNE